MSKRLELCIENISKQEGGGNRSWLDREGALWLDGESKEFVAEILEVSKNPHISYHHGIAWIFSPWMQKVKVFLIDICERPKLSPINWQLVRGKRRVAE